jgi:hypothetical protein
LNFGLCFGVLLVYRRELFQLCVIIKPYFFPLLLTIGVNDEGYQDYLLAFGSYYFFVGVRARGERVEICKDKRMGTIGEDPDIHTQNSV